MVAYKLLVVKRVVALKRRHLSIGVKGKASNDGCQSRGWIGVWRKAPGNRGQRNSGRLGGSDNNADSGCRPQKLDSRDFDW